MDIKLQAIYSALTTAQKLQQENNTQILIYTDEPALFQKYFTGAPQEKIHVIPMTDTTVQDWLGIDQYIFRVKIKSLIDAHKRFPEAKLIYLDTDTFPRMNPALIADKITTKSSVLHTQEGLFGRKETYGLRMQRKELSKHRITVNNQPFTYPTGMEVWNAGVIGLHPKIATHLLEETLHLADEVFHQTKNYFSEQLSFNYHIQNTTRILAADTLIEHYWHVKELNNRIENFVEETMPLSFVEKMDLPIDHSDIPTVKQFKSIKHKLWRGLNKLGLLEDYYTFCQ